MMKHSVFLHKTKLEWVVLSSDLICVKEQEEFQLETPASSITSS